MEIRNVFASAMAILLAALSNPALATPPTAPDDFRVEIYSDNAAELFWGRSIDSDGVVLGYDLTRNGDSLGVLDRLSFFVDDVNAGDREVWTVTAVDFDGERSETATLEFVAGSTSDTPLVSDGIEVTSNTISLPADGYYQVQTADGSSTICEGVRTCIVEPGTYLVINLTAGLRFNGIEVGARADSDSTSADDSGFTVSGNTIVLLDDDYYQVQTANGGATLCEGEATCTVEPGTYLVINLTRGQRFDGVEVGSLEGDSPDTSEPTLPPLVRTRLGQIFEIVNSDFAEIGVRASMQIADQYEASFNDPQFVVTDFFFGRLFGEGNFVYDCIDGGTGRGSIRSTLSPMEESFRFEECRIGTITLDGASGGRTQTFTPPGAFERYSYSSSFSISDDSVNESVTYTGLFTELSADSGYSFGVIELPSVTENVVTIERDQNPYSVLSYNLQSANADVLLVDGSPGFTISAQVLLEQRAGMTSIESIEPLRTNLADGSTNTGSLSILGPDYFYQIVADNDDFDTFDLIINENGSSTVFTVPWGGVFSLESFDPSRIDVGF